MIKQAMATALVIGSTLSGTAVAQADAAKIPKGFLLTERAAKGPVMEDEEWWEISNSLSRPLELNPCGRKGKPRDGRVAMRTIGYSTSAPSGRAEQLVLYRNASSARAAFRKLRADLARCRERITAKRKHGYTAKPLRAGDEGLFATGVYYTKGKRPTESDVLGVAARRGAALFFYTDIGWPYPSTRKKIVRQAQKMAKKVCDLPGVCR
ncbi:hypothetical protein ABZ897_38275 [Nonomuraea sp. NPDC046802]|uniref:hypothetical protein n=1 Tax=Nonomuraea sp. NPDC046802 TaxID=3154919 RepID=UPI0033EDAB2A